MRPELFLALALATATPQERLEAWKRAALTCDQSRQVLTRTSSLAQAEAKSLRLALTSHEAAQDATQRQREALEALADLHRAETIRAQHRATRAERWLVWGALGIVGAALAGVAAGAILAGR